MDADCNRLKFQNVVALHNDGERPARTFAFGPFLLIPERQLLLKGDRRVRIGARALDILTALAARAGETVSKRELMAAAWPGIHVDDSNLKVNIHSLRRALGDDQAAPAYIATVAGRGYRLIAGVRAGDAAADAQEQTRGGLPAGEVIELIDAMRRKHVLTMVGLDRAGNRTAAAVAAQSDASKDRGSVRYVELDRTDDATSLAAAVAEALGVNKRRGPPLVAILETPGSGRMLIVLEDSACALPARATPASDTAAAKRGPDLLATAR